MGQIENLEDQDSQSQGPKEKNKEGHGVPEAEDGAQKLGDSMVTKVKKRDQNRARKAQATPKQLLAQTLANTNQTMSDVKSGAKIHVGTDEQ